MRILVVEDERKIADSIKKGLQQASYAVDVSYDGRKGYGLATTQDYDVIILDLMLPGMDGTTICKKLRQEKISTPILMLTAKGRIKDRVEGLNAGSDDYLIKPFAFQELLARVKALTRRPKGSISSILTINNLSLNTLTYKVKRSGKTIDLSKKEFALLQYLLVNKENILTKEQIINHVWDYNADILPNTVEVFIGYLRNKIDKPFAKSTNLIHTVRGFGYKISTEK